jgi:hypothetical protein
MPRGYGHILGMDSRGVDRGGSDAGLSFKIGEMSSIGCDCLWP